MRPAARVSGNPADLWSAIVGLGILPRPRIASFALWIAIAVIGLCILWRRAIGACPVELSSSLAAFSVTGAAIVSLLAFGLYRSTETQDTRLRSRTVAAGAFLWPLLFAVGVTPDGPTRMILAVATVSLVVGNTFLLYAQPEGRRQIWRRALDSLSTTDAKRWLAPATKESSSSVENSDGPPSAGPPEEVCHDADELEDAVEGEIQQWLTRRLTATGQDCIEGALKVRFDSREKQSTVHVPFSPPFEQIPEVACHVVDDSGARAKVAAVYSYGARIEIKRTGDSEPQLVEMAFTASAAASHAA